MYLRLMRDKRTVLLNHTLACGVDDSETDTSYLEFLLQHGWNKDQKLQALGNCSLPAFRLLMAQIKSQANASDFRGILFGICVGNKSGRLECLLEEMESANVKAENIVNMRDEHGEIALHTAAMSGPKSLRCLDILLANGARTDVINKTGRTPLYYALNPIDYGDPNNLVMINAIKKARERESQQELTQCLDTTRPRTLPGDDGPCFRQHIFTLFYKEMLAALEHLGKEVSTRILNEQVDVCGETPFILAVKYRDAKIITLLLEYGADPEVKTRFGQTALYVAAMVVNVEVVEVLLEARAKPDTDTDYGCDAVSASIDGVGKQGEGSPRIALLLIEHGAKLHDESPGKLYRLLEWALDAGNAKVMQRLAEAGAPMELRDMNGVSPYQRARRAGHDNVATIIRIECQVGTQTI
jgi:ankyrin repeat protein